MLCQVLQMFLYVSSCCQVLQMFCNVLQMLCQVLKLLWKVLQCIQMLSSVTDVVSVKDVSLCIQMLCQMVYSFVCLLAAGSCCLVSATGLSQGPLCLYNTSAGPTWGVPLQPQPDQ